jgi:predicted small metal-binding protein
MTACSHIDFPTSSIKSINSPKENKMTKVIHCRELGFDCDGVVRAETEEEALQMVAQHAKEVHGMQEVPAEVAEKARQVMREE